jgi:hypothetical protein
MIRTCRVLVIFLHLLALAREHNSRGTACRLLCDSGGRCQCMRCLCAAPPRLTTTVCALRLPVRAAPGGRGRPVTASRSEGL